MTCVILPFVPRSFIKRTPDDKVIFKMSSSLFKIVKTREHRQTNAVITILNLRLNPTRILTLTLTLNENEIYFKYLKYLLSSVSFCDYFLPSTYPWRKELKRFYYNLYQTVMADIFVRFERCSFNVSKYLFESLFLNLFTTIECKVALQRLDIFESFLNGHLKLEILINL